MNSCLASALSDDRTPLLAAVVQLFRPSAGRSTYGRREARHRADWSALDERTLRDIGLTRGDLHARLEGL